MFRNRMLGDNACKIVYETIVSGSREHFIHGNVALAFQYHGHKVCQNYLLYIEEVDILLVFSFGLRQAQSKQVSK